MTVGASRPAGVQGALPAAFGAGAGEPGGVPGADPGDPADDHAGIPDGAGLDPDEIGRAHV